MFAQHYRFDIATMTRPHKAATRIFPMADGPHMLKEKFLQVAGTLLCKNTPMPSQTQATLKRIKISREGKWK